MVKYTCPTCHKEFNKKSHYLDHTENKKKPCVPTGPIFTPELLQNPPEILQSDEEQSDRDTIIYKNGQLYTLASDQTQPKIYICVYCQSTFKRKDNLKRHISIRCQVKKLQDQEKEAIFLQLIRKDKIIEDNNDKLDKLLKQNENLQTKYDMILRQNEDFKKQNELLQEQIKTIINKNINKNIIKNQQNNLNINIMTNKLVKFGEEDLKKINLKYFIEPICKKFGKAALVNLTENIHFNPEYPEYQNVYISDINREKYMIFNGKGWMLKENTVLYDVLENLFKFCRIKHEETQEIYKNNKKMLDKVNNIFMKYFNLLSGDFDIDDPDLCKRAEDFQTMVNNEIKLLLYNNKDNVIENYNKMVNSNTEPLLVDKADKVDKK